MSKRPEGWDATDIAMHAKVGQENTLVDMVEAGADALEELLKATGQRVEKGDTIKFCRNYPGVGMKQYYAFTFEAPNVVCSIPEEAGE